MQFFCFETSSPLLQNCPCWHAFDPFKDKKHQKNKFSRSETPHMMDLLRLHWSQIPFESITFKCHPFFPKKSKHFLAVENGGGGRKNSIFMSKCVFKSHQVSLTSHQDVFEGTYGGWWWVVVCGVVVYAWIVKREGKTCFETEMSILTKLQILEIRTKGPPSSLTLITSDSSYKPPTI